MLNHRKSLPAKGKFLLVDIRIYSHSASLTQEVAAGLQLYFDKCLGNNLLYRFERGQYSELRKKRKCSCGLRYRLR